MNYIDPHVHMVSRVTDDYERMARMGCVAVSEPAFWAGFDRGSVDGFRDYFRQLTEFEPKRAILERHSALHLAVHQRQGSGEHPAVAGGHRHDPGVSRQAGTCWASAKSASTRTRPTSRRSFASISIWHAKTSELILIHTPHLQDKYKGTRMIVDMLKERKDHPAAAGLHRPRRGAHGQARQGRRASGAG